MASSRWKQKACLSALNTRGVPAAQSGHPRSSTRHWELELRDAGWELGSSSLAGGKRPRVSSQGRLRLRLDPTESCTFSTPEVPRGACLVSTVQPLGQKHLSETALDSSPLAMPPAAVRYTELIPPNWRPPLQGDNSTAPQVGLAELGFGGQSKGARAQPAPLAFSTLLPQRSPTD
ncbi:splicing factor U2AF 35 kDa subunit [Platysternon megacephalum]|uniref:Splicing factor U2AF 35 kDa subunit n=1 Tax=Platysternon megacephalum TaxID=55544 RepID=A0A4D9E7W1_9SAUR|nr:splicing factor U2AF 35 kDa subunit [Platysternon megacephalum]